MPHHHQKRRRPECRDAKPTAKPNCARLIQPVPHGPTHHRDPAWLRYHAGGPAGVSPFSYEQSGRAAKRGQATGRARRPVRHPRGRCATAELLTGTLPGPGTGAAPSRVRFSPAGTPADRARSVPAAEPAGRAPQYHGTVRPAVHCGRADRDSPALVARQRASRSATSRRRPAGSAHPDRHPAASPARSTPGQGRGTGQRHGRPGQPGLGHRPLRTEFAGSTERHRSAPMTRCRPGAAAWPLGVPGSGSGSSLVAFARRPGVPPPQAVHRGRSGAVRRSPVSIDDVGPRGRAAQYRTGWPAPAAADDSRPRVRYRVRERGCHVVSHSSAGAALRSAT